MSIDRVSVKAITKIEAEVEKRGLRTQLRFTYENASESLIIKFMLGAAHGMTAGKPRFVLETRFHNCLGIGSFLLPALGR